jgi:ABC-type lipoprotein export system ATPase subunit
MKGEQVMIQSITILGGKGKSGSYEPVKSIELAMGDVVSIVGPTGSGKTTLINDIELFADGNTHTGRTILINGKRPPDEYREDPSRHPIALITQHTTFLSDLPVGEFLATHARIRTASHSQVDEKVQHTMDFANQLTGEPILTKSRMTELSGGQTRALLIADATVLCETPVVLLDEVENAGINRARTLELLKAYRKIFVFVTHDPRISLLSDFRIIMSGGSIVSILRTDAEEKKLSREVTRIDGILTMLREKIRSGERLALADLGGLA